MDTQARDRAGCEPARRVIEDLRSISDLDGLSAFLLDPDRSAGVPTLIRVNNTMDYNEHRWVTYVSMSEATFGSTVNTLGMDVLSVDPDSSQYRTRAALVRNILMRVGYTEEEAKEAFEGRLNLERKILRLTEGKEDGRRTMSMDELEPLAGRFPLRRLAEVRGYGKADVFRVNEPGTIVAIGELYTDENLDQLRNYFICGYVLEASGWLDTEAFNVWVADYGVNVLHCSLTMPERNGTIEETGVNLATTIAPTLVGQVYVEAYNLAPVKEFVTTLSKQAVESHKEIVSACP
ncbi:MAG: hypothetical protein IJ088_10080 [Clostridia bacterium]|nr:hypothetical protein [Clostridia bacterium]